MELCKGSERLDNIDIRHFIRVTPNYMVFENEIYLHQILLGMCDPNIHMLFSTLATNYTWKPHYGAKYLFYFLLLFPQNERKIY